MKEFKMRVGAPKTAYLLLIIIIICYLPAFAGWSENVRLTYRGNEIMPQVIARNDTVHVVWDEMGYGHVLYIRSTNGGETWGSIADLIAPSGHFASSATLNLGEHGLLVSWFDHDTIQGLTRIAIAKSSNNGRSWSQPSYINTENPNHFGFPVSAVKGDSIFLVYFSNRDDSTGLSPLKSMYSYNYGQTWSNEVTVGHYLAIEPQPPRMKYCNVALLLAFSCVPDSDHFNQLYRTSKHGCRENMV